MNNTNSYFKNPHLEGETFYLKGNHHKPGILLIHGFTATTAEVRLLGEGFNQHGYHVYAPLLPGHGTKPEDLNHVSWQDWVSAAEHALNKLKEHTQQIIIGGESMGGLVALHLASKHPEILSVLTYAPALIITTPIWKQYLLRLLIPFIPYIKKPESDDNLPWQGYTVIPLNGAYQLSKLQKVVFRNLSKINQPMLIVQGRLDPTVSPEVPGTLVNLTGSSYFEIHWMDKSGHCVAIDCQHGEVIKISLAFINKTINN